MQVLLIEGEPCSSAWLTNRLSGSGFVPRTFGSVEQALDDGAAETAAALIVDIGQGGPMGSAMVKPLRRSGLETPLMVLSPRGDWRDKVDCLDAGADDYVVKPVRSEEVVARLRAIVRRTAGSATGQLVYGDLVLDLNASCAWQDGTCLDLTKSEFRLLRVLLSTPNRIVPRRELSARIHFAPSVRSDNSLEVLVARLRRKIGRDRVKTIRGMGYRLRIDERPEASAEEISPDPCAKCDRVAR